MPPVEIIISKGDQNIAIKISDRGGGLMAQYLGGDIETRSIEDYGTDVYIYLQNCPETCFEEKSEVIWLK